MSYTEDALTYEDLVRMLDGLCWSARRYGHDDYGLDSGVDINGKAVDDDAEQKYHSEAVGLAKNLAVRFGIDSSGPFPAS